MTLLLTKEKDIRIDVDKVSEHAVFVLPIMSRFSLYGRKPWSDDVIAIVIWWLGLGWMTANDPPRGWNSY